MILYVRTVSLGVSTVVVKFRNLTACVMDCVGEWVDLTT